MCEIWEKYLKYLVNTGNTRSQEPQENSLNSGCHYSGNGGKQDPGRQVALSHFKNSRTWAGNVAQLADCLPSTHKALGSSPAPYKPEGVAHVCDSSIQEVETGEPEPRSSSAT